MSTTTTTTTTSDHRLLSCLPITTSSVDLEWCIQGCGKRTSQSSLYCSATCFQAAFVQLKSTCQPCNRGDKDNTLHGCIDQHTLSHRPQPQSNQHNNSNHNHTRRYRSRSSSSSCSSSSSTETAVIPSSPAFNPVQANDISSFSFFDLEFKNRSGRSYHSAAGMASHYPRSSISSESSIAPPRPISFFLE